MATNYVNPIGKGLTIGRIDEGVDFAGSGDLYALGSGTITSIARSGWPGTNYILLHLDDGKWVYYAENIEPAVSAGQHVKAGQKIGHARGAFPFIEIGWATATPGEALAHGHYSEGQQTAEGKDFAALLNTFGWKIPGAAGSSTMGGGGGTQTATLTGKESWNPIVQAIDEFNPFLGQLIQGFKGKPATIGDLAGGIGGLVTDFAAAIKMVSWLFVPAHWLRILAFFAGLVFLGGSFYMLKEAL